MLTASVDFFRLSLVSNVSESGICLVGCLESVYLLLVYFFLSELLEALQVSALAILSKSAVRDRSTALPMWEMLGVTLDEEGEESECFRSGREGSGVIEKETFWSVADPDPLLIVWLCDKRSSGM